MAISGTASLLVDPGLVFANRGVEDLQTQGLEIYSICRIGDR